MGLLDDLKAQAEHRNKPAGEQPAAPGAEEFYRAQVKQRMIMAKDFFTQLFNQLNEMNLVIQAKYPLLPEGKTVTLQQQGYKAYSDDIPNPRLVTFGFNCILTSPTTYDVRGLGPALAQGELLERFQFKYVKLEARDQNQLVIGARFKLEGPLPVKCALQFDEAKLIIKILLTNFIGPGTSQYNLNPEQLNEAFLDHLGKYLIRKEAKLFQEEISDDAKAMLRKKMQQEQLQREAELRAAEEQLKAEEMARKQNSTKEQLKQAVSQSVAENKEKLKKLMDEQVRDKGEKLKSLFGKLTNRAGSDTAAEQSAASPAINPSQSAKPTGNPIAQGQPPVNRPAGQSATAQQNATRPKPAADQKKPTPPKVFQASAANPFLKPQDFEPVPSGDEEQTEVTEVNADSKNPAAPLPVDTAIPATAKPPTPAIPPAAVQARPAAGSNASVAKPVNPVPPAKTAAVQTEMKKPVAPSTDHTATPTTQTLLRSSAAVHARPIAETNASVAKPVNPAPPAKTAAAPAEMKKSTAAPIELELSLEPIASDSESPSPRAPAETKKPMAPSPAQSATPATSTPSPATKATPVAAPTAPVATPTRASTPTKPPAAPKEPEGLELELVMEPIVPNSKPSSPAVPAETKKSMAPSPAQAATPESKRSPQSTAPDSNSASLATKPKSPQPKSSSEVSSLSLEDQLERDLARFMENDQPPPSSAGETADDPSATSAELDFDLSAPDALEIHFEDTDKTSKQKNSEPKK